MLKQKITAAVSLLMVSIMLTGLCSCAGVQPVLTNSAANEQTVKIYDYLKSVQGRYTLSAQQESTWMGDVDYEFNYIFEATGKYPAIRGFDYMNDDFEGVNQRALEWWNKGGLVTICWHTGADFSGAWEEAMSGEAADWEKLFTPGTPENKAMLEGMDKAAAALKQLEKQGVTVIWRPFHEADGGWFWWGKGGAENFKMLWKTMYDRYTNYWHLNNLIWVLGLSHNGKHCSDWYVGNSYCDIIGADSYDRAEFEMLYNVMNTVNRGNKPICMHECGANPTAEELEKMQWLWFMTWHTEYLTDSNSPQELEKLYNSDRVITLDELDF